MGNTIMLSNATAQATETKKFQDQDIKTIVSQIRCKTGPHNAQINGMVGFASAPVEGDRLIVVEIGSALFAIGGSCQELEEELNLSPGDRCMFSTDADGKLMSVMKTNADGSQYSSNDNGAYELQADGTFIVNGGNLEVAPPVVVP